MDATAAATRTATVVSTVFARSEGVVRRRREQRGDGRPPEATAG